MKTLFKSKILGRNLDQFVMQRYEIVVPMIDNSGEYVEYIDNVREGLFFAGFQGWNEYLTNGYWQGKFEAGYTIQIYSAPERNGQNTLEMICNIARKAMPDQKFIQVAVSDGFTTLVEA